MFVDERQRMPRPARKLRLQIGDLARDVGRDVGLLDLLAQRGERLVARGRVGGDVAVGDDRAGPVVEAARGHERVVERERDRVAVGNRPRGQHLAQLRDVRGLRADALGVAVGELVEVADLGRAEIARRRLRLRRADLRKPRLDLRRRRLRELEVVRRDGVAHDLAEQRRDPRVGGGVADVGVGRVVLLGLEVDVRQGRLGRRRDDARDVAEVVGQRRKQRDVADRRRARRRRVDRRQHAVALAEVQRDVRDVREQLRGEDRAHARRAQRALVVREERLLRVAGGVVGDRVRRERHGGGDEVVGERDVLGAHRVRWPELERVEALLATGLEAVVGDDRAGEVRAVVAEVRHAVERVQPDPELERLRREVVVKLKGLRVEEVELRRVGVDADDEDLHLLGAELAGHVVRARERLERRAVGDEPRALGDRQVAAGRIERRLLVDGRLRVDRRRGRVDGRRRVLDGGLGVDGLGVDGRVDRGVDRRCGVLAVGRAGLITRHARDSKSAHRRGCVHLRTPGAGRRGCRACRRHLSVSPVPSSPSSRAAPSPPNRRPA